MRWGPLSVLLFVAPLAACGGGEGADADALCERATINGLEDQLTDDGLDFQELREALEVVRAAADGDLDPETDALLEVSDQFDEALEGVDLEDDDEVDEALDEVAEDLDEDLVEDVDEVLTFVDEECDTELAQADEDDDPVEEDPVDLAIEELCAEETVGTLVVLFEGGDDRDFVAERDALDLVADAAEGNLDDQADLLEEFVDVIESVDTDDEEETQEAVDAALEAAFDDEELADLAAASEDVKEFVDAECGTNFAEAAEGDDPVTTAPEDDGGDSSLEDFADLVESCEDGDMADCDELFFDTPVDSEAEDIGRRCGGVGDETTAGRCEELFG